MTPPRVTFSRPLAASLVLLLAAGCARTGEIDVSRGGAGITAVRSACPIVAVPAGTGDVTLFDPPASRTASAIDTVATISNVRSTCDDQGSDVITRVTFDVRARRVRVDAPRDVTLPYFIAITRGGSSVVAKRLGQIALHFDAGQPVATASAEATSAVARSAATLPTEVRDRLTKKRKAGDEDAALDPLADPQVRTAVASASFEALVGFQLTPDQLKYNATR
ncbi:hypothetical protein [Sphingomonas sp. BK235]|uniref:hypothetical protein n=1 Tax=Sphingomonas sp. BK235 TaxID=2512131 RepID=UPI0010E91FBC|nr:hypothetical protein [Sphingomonas sp. BK235]TCP36649.1 hypothetical protein EV292_101145 [Sphingomonas sp. BK235]